MPMTGIKDGKLIGTDGELMVLIAERLGLEVVPHMMDWSAEIQSTKQGKVDIMHGAMGWIPARSEIMLLTDPIYYFGTLLAQKKDTNWSTFEDMKGRSVATVSGFTLVPELKGVEGIGEVKLYDTTDGALRDLIAGRVDMAILDPPLMQLAIQENPDWNLHQVPLQPQPDKYPIMSQVYNIVFGINPEQQELHDAFNQEIAKIWADCTNVEVMRNYGLGDKSLVHAAAAGREPAQRRRPAQGLGGAERRPLLLSARHFAREAPAMDRRSSGALLSAAAEAAGATWTRC